LEREQKYIDVAQKRIDAIQPEPFDLAVFSVQSKAKTAERVRFSLLLEHGYLQAGQILYFGKEHLQMAWLKPDGRLRTPDGFEGSIHQVGSHYMAGAPCNGWAHWYCEKGGQWVSLDSLREQFRLSYHLPSSLTAGSHS